ncbi:hypothetical protein ACFWTE_28405, partial [Nocardiopsis sp. NPDC058631]|uniref:hypothetical protein n=1 Tax=Nocardiopsis sp. NPDC058631 TaxID=3346566 RepID=UPI00364BE035
MSETTTPSETVPVRLVGGPADWHGQTLTIHTREELEGPRDALGTYLISSGVPADHPDPGARAVYEPGGCPDPGRVRPAGPDDGPLGAAGPGHRPVLPPG